MDNVKCPPNQDLCVKDYNNIINFIKDFYPDKNNCKSVFGDCSTDLQYIINHINESGTITPENIKNNISNMDLMTLNNQLKYNLSELVRSKVVYKNNSSKFLLGSYEWWKNNVWGTNRLTQFIYVISSCICFMGLIYFIWKFISDTNIPIIDLIIIGFFSIIFMILMIINFIEESKSKNEKVSNKIYEFAKWEKIIELLFCIIGLALGISIIYNFNSNFKRISILLLLPLIISYNFYFSFYMPQLLIIGVFLQKIILSQYNRNINNIIYGLLFIICSFFIIYKYIFNKSNIETDECTQKSTESSNIYVEILPYIFLIFTILLIIFTYYTKNRLNMIDEINNWSLYLAPFIKLILYIK